MSRLIKYTEADSSELLPTPRARVLRAWSRSFHLLSPFFGPSEDFSLRDGRGDQKKVNSSKNFGKNYTNLVQLIFDKFHLSSPFFTFFRLKFMKSLILLVFLLNFSGKSRISWISSEKRWKKVRKGETYKKSIALDLCSFFWSFLRCSPFFTFFHLFSPFFGPRDRLSGRSLHWDPKKKDEKRWKKWKLVKLLDQARRTKKTAHEYLQ